LTEPDNELHFYESGHFNKEIPFFQAGAGAAGQSAGRPQSSAGAMSTGLPFSSNTAGIVAAMAGGLPSQQ
jgi:hypothetical protein